MLNILSSLTQVVTPPTLSVDYLVIAAGGGGGANRGAGLSLIHI